MNERYLCIHGHFYQPPRHNPWLEAIEVQDSAAPFHDWNERIAAECYAPNATVHIVDGDATHLESVNTYAHISFNFGPTLLAWLEKADPGTYRQILDADRLSQAAHEGHGNAIAQCYNHMIMPLANRRDKVTQVIWGIRDFQARFGRDPEGMWLPETAVDQETLDILAERGIRFTILSPHQASRVRAPGESHWRDMSDGSIDPSRSYRCLLPSGREITMFFYDGPIAKAIAFEGVLGRGEALIERLIGGFHEGRTHTQLLHVATDGETYGHHHRFGEKALVYALRTIAEKKLATLTNYGQYRERFPPDHLVEVYENTSWSCAHGIERWRSDCGCQAGGKPGWHQRWRMPLRESLDWLRDRLSPLFEEEGGKFLIDPWVARDDYIDVILDRSRTRVEQFLRQHARRELLDTEAVCTLKLLEMQRYAMLMYTSCAWFFADISGIETVQNLAYAARAIQLAEEAAGHTLEAGFLERLAHAPSNLSHLAENGREVYLKRVKPSVITLPTVLAHYAIRALFRTNAHTQTLYSFEVRELDSRMETRDAFTLATGLAKVQSQITWERMQACYVVLHVCGYDVRCSVKSHVDLSEYERLRDEVFRLYASHSLTDVVRALDVYFGEDFFSLKDLFLDERRRIAHLFPEGASEDMRQNLS